MSVTVPCAVYVDDWRSVWALHLGSERTERSAGNRHRFREGVNALQGVTDAFGTASKAMHQMRRPC